MKLDSIQVFSKIHDIKIDAYNISFELSKEDYLAFAHAILDENEYQRKRIKSASSVYSLMKADLQKGCVIPPMVLALGQENPQDEVKIFIDHIKNLNKKHLHDAVKDFLEKNTDKIKILDGLQRTNMLLDVQKEFKNPELFTDQEEYRKKFHDFHSTKLRFEIYIGINNFGILYRMLTLNAGQNPMSLRHQIDILYSKFFREEGIEGEIYLIREIDVYTKRVGLGKYHFDDMIQGLDAYIDGHEFTIDRKDIIQYVKDLENLSNNFADYDLFETFVKTYHTFVTKISELAENWSFSYEKLSTEMKNGIKRFFPETQSMKDDAAAAYIDKSAFGKNAIGIFVSSQSIIGMGAALHKQNLKTVQQNIANIHFESSPDETLSSLISNLFTLKANAKKIGDTQRNFFKNFFTQLLKEEGVSVEKALETSYRRTIIY